MHKSLVIGAVLSVALTVSACGPDAPKCSDPSTLNTLKQILKENNAFYPRVAISFKGDQQYWNLNIPIELNNLEIENVITESQLENKRGFNCSAYAIAIISDDTRDKVIAELKRTMVEDKITPLERVSNILKNSAKIGLKYSDSGINIKYTVQLTDAGEPLVKASWKSR